MSPFFLALLFDILHRGFYTLLFLFLGNIYRRSQLGEGFRNLLHMLVLNLDETHEQGVIACG
jgi:hypothetical protein